jgi:hypothetical protein
MCANPANNYIKHFALTDQYDLNLAVQYIVRARASGMVSITPMTFYGSFLKPFFILKIFGPQKH